MTYLWSHPTPAGVVSHSHCLQCHQLQWLFAVPICRHFLNSFGFTRLSDVFTSMFSCMPKLRFLLSSIFGLGLGLGFYYTLCMHIILLCVCLFDTKRRSKECILKTVGSCTPMKHSGLKGFLCLCRGLAPGGS